MLNVMHWDAQGPQALTRRQMLRIGFLGLGGLTLPDLFRLQAASPAPKKETAVIVLWTHGGPSHLETYDLKPNAPTETRSLFKPIRTKVPGLDVCELLPKHAASADKFTLLRSVAHDEADHGFGTRRLCTGFRDAMPGSNNGYAYYPAMECVVGRALGGMRDGLPVSMNLGAFHASTPWRGAGFWGQKFDVPETAVHPIYREAKGLQDAILHVPRDRFDDRRQLLTKFDALRQGLDRSRALDNMDEYRRQAYEVLTSDRTRKALDLRLENARLRDRYNEMGFADDVLLARRLVEAGVRFVNVYIGGSRPGTNANHFNWDDHAVNWDLPTAMKNRLPYYDHIVTTLIEDIYARGLNERVLVIATGEFGRTPRLEFKGNIGRDHWPHAMSILVSGGRKRGDVIGTTNSRGEHPTSRRFDPHNFLATVYTWLGIDPGREYVDLSGRPLPLTRGGPIEGLL